MELQESMAYVKGCFRDEPASCECACPFQMEIRSFLKKMAKGRWPAAYRDMSTAIPFPAVAAALCPRPCQGRCQRSMVGDAPLNMGALERACVGFAAAEQAQAFPIQAKSQRIAVAGAGPAGLSCALALARKKYQVTVFDAAAGWGGHLRSHPQFSAFDADFEKQFAAQTVEFRFGETADEALLSAYDAVYIATGSPAADFGLGDSWDSTLLATARPGWFMGGGVCGMPLMESMAAGRTLSQLMEAFLQTGRASLIVQTDTAACTGHFVEHPGEAQKPEIKPANADAYTKDEAKAEASRCMQCICDGCMNACELMAHYKKSPGKLATDISADSHTAPPFSNCTATRQTYSCNLCGRCSDICPENVDVGALLRLSREDRRQRGKWIPGIYDYWLRTLEFHGGDGFYASKEPCTTAFFPGCQLSSSMPEQTLAAWRFLRDRMHSGVILGCCGAPAVWSGERELQAANLAKLRSAWETMGRPTLITACATCTDQLKAQLPEASIRSLYALLDEENVPVSPLPYPEVAVFDPCAARRDDLLHRSVVSLAKKSGCRAEALQDGGTCCGYGGLIRLANPALYREITDHRTAESDKPYLVYCANCLEVFRAKGKPAVHILDAVFGGGDAQPTLQQKRSNTLRVKGAVMEALEHRSFAPQGNPWDAWTLTFSKDARDNMEDKLITDSDAAETIFAAEQAGAYFEDDAGLRSACLARKVLTYWVDYRKITEDAYAVENVYCHRMHIGEEPQS